MPSHQAETRQSALPHPSQGRSSMRERIEWSIKVPIFRNPVILRQLALAIGIPFGLIFVIMLASGASIADLRYPALLIGLLFFLTWLFIRIVWSGKYDAEFVIDGKGIRCRTAASSRTARLRPAATGSATLRTGTPRTLSDSASIGRRAISNRLPVPEIPVS